VGERPSVHDIAPPPPPPQIPNRRSSSISKGNKGVLVKRKNENRGGDVKRRRSSTSESPRIDNKSQQGPNIASSISSPPKNETSPDIANLTTENPSVNPQNGEKKSGLAGFDDYSDSDPE
jgi:hypothetical protein